MLEPTHGGGEKKSKRNKRSKSKRKNRRNCKDIVQELVDLFTPLVMTGKTKQKKTSGGYSAKTSSSSSKPVFERSKIIELAKSYDLQKLKEAAEAVLEHLAKYPDTDWSKHLPRYVMHFCYFRGINTYLHHITLLSNAYLQYISPNVYPHRIYVYLHHI